MMKRVFSLFFVCIISTYCAEARQPVDEGLGRHNFFYAGQSKRMRMFIVKDGQVSWTYENKQGKGEISDAVLMTDGHILIAHQYGIAELSQDGQVIWSYEAPAGTEIHTIQPIGKTHVVYVQNGRPAKVVVMEIPSKQIVREFELPTAQNGSVHGQFRNARLTSRGKRFLWLIWDWDVSVNTIAMVKRLTDGRAFFPGLFRSCPRGIF